LNQHIVVVERLFEKMPGCQIAAKAR